MSVESKNIYAIEYKALATGRYEYEYTLDNKFFSQFPYGETDNGNVKIKVLLIVFSSGLELEFTINGEVELPCDRCGEIVQIPIKGKYKLHVNYGEKNSDISDSCEEITLSHEEYMLDLTQFLYEYTTLSIPVKRVHKNIKECNQETIARLGNYTTEQQAQQTDGRWDKLKELYN